MEGLKETVALEFFQRFQALRIYHLSDISMCPGRNFLLEDVARNKGHRRNSFKHANPRILVAIKLIKMKEVAIAICREHKAGRPAQVQALAQQFKGEA